MKINTVPWISNNVKSSYSLAFYDQGESVQKAASIKALE